MIIDDPLFLSPTGDFSIIRYMDLYKFEDLLATSSLYFTRTDRLQKQDSFEGSLTKEQFQFIRNQLFGPDMYKSFLNLVKQKAHRLGQKNIRNLQMNGVLITGDRNYDLRNIRNKFQKDYQFLKQGLFINCWSMSDYEQYQMWKLFTEAGKGIAIQTHYKNLKAALENTDQIKPGYITYEDFEIAASNMNKIPLVFQGKEGATLNILTHMLFRKTKYYETEREFRLILKDEEFFDSQDIYELDFSKPNKNERILSKINLVVSLEKIILHPGANKEFFNLVINILKRTNIEHLIERIHYSALDSKPFEFE